MYDKEAFSALALELRRAMQHAKQKADERGPHGRRFALVFAAVEAAWLQAKQGERS